MQSFHFISDLPRAGSTLLSAILSQNPRFHAGVSSPVASFFSSLVSQVSAGSEWSTRVSIAQRRRLLHGLFEAYYADLPPEKQVVFDTNRVWTARLPALLDLFPQVRVIACVRNVAWVMDSIERLYRRTPTRTPHCSATRASAARCTPAPRRWPSATAWWGSPIRV